jgi:hypothetical protein
MYRGETCDECGMAVAFFTRSYWNATDELWSKVMETSAGVLCPPCFTIAAKEKGISVHWQAVVLD